MGSHSHRNRCGRQYVVQRTTVVIIQDGDPNINDCPIGNHRPSHHFSRDGELPVYSLVELLPDDPEVHGLLAMMLLHDSRREARFRDGEVVLIGDQDRSRWNTEQIAGGRAELDRALAIGRRGPYVLQAAIASLHAETPCDWGQIADLYSELSRQTGSPVMELNRAIAVAEIAGPEAGLRVVDQLDLDDFRYLHATRADLLRRLGRAEEAREAYRRARALTDAGAERRFLDRRIAELEATSGSA